MSEEDDIRRARERVTQLAREVEELAMAAPPPDVFFQGFLQRLVTALGAVAGVVWMRDASGRVIPAVEINIAVTGLPQAGSANERLLAETLRTGETNVVAPDANGELTPPTRHVHLLGGLIRDREVVGVVQVLHHPEAPRNAYTGYAQFVERLAGYASSYLQRSAAPPPTPPAEFWQRFEHFALNLARGRNTREVAAIVANDGRQLLQVDRCSVAFMPYSRARLLAVSGVESVNRRSNQVRCLEQLTGKVCTAREPFWFTGQTELPEAIRDVLSEYLLESHARMLVVQPLFRPEPIVPATEKKSPAQPVETRKPFAALIIEQSADARPSPTLRDRLTMLGDHTSAALANAWDQERILFLPLWRLLGRWLAALRGSRLYASLAATAAVIAVAAALVFVKWPYRVEAKGRLMPTRQQCVFAAVDGEVTTVHVRSGQVVSEGTPLLDMRNEALQREWLEARNRLNELQKQLDTIEFDLKSAVQTKPRSEITQLEGKRGQTRIEINGAREQVRLLTEQIEKLHVKAPRDGVVATFQVEQTLKNRPVQRGELLVDLMDETSPWRLELEVPDYRMGHVLRRQKELRRSDLDVEFLIATTSETTFQAKLSTAANRSVVAEEAGSVVEVYSDINPDDEAKLREADRLRIGAEVKARIDCGPSPLGYVLFGDVIEFVRKRILLW
jgi:multidrug efflux pump subunit AcrA (membrane-fusion protein)